MTKTAFTSDGILDDSERLKPARKCLALLEGEIGKMTGNESQFVESVIDQVSEGSCSERQLAWLRDLVSKYAA